MAENYPSSRTSFRAILRRTLRPLPAQIGRVLGATILLCVAVAIVLASRIKTGEDATIIFFIVIAIFMIVGYLIGVYLLAKFFNIVALGTQHLVDRQGLSAAQKLDRPTLRRKLINRSCIFAAVLGGSIYFFFSPVFQKIEHPLNLFIFGAILLLVFFLAARVDLLWRQWRQLRAAPQDHSAPPL
jgi:Kef-type K+ transport system membrane component KefB